MVVGVKVYYDPEKFGLKIIGEIEWSDGCGQYDKTVVWQREGGGALLDGRVLPVTKR